MKNLTIPLAIIVGSIIISISIYFSITNEKRMQFKICMNSYLSGAQTKKDINYNEFKKDVKELCKLGIYKK